MKSRFSGMVKTLAFGASFAMTFGLLACGDDNSSGASDNNSEGGLGAASSFADIKADGCNFEKDDKVWKYAFSLKQQGVDSDAARYVEFDGDKTRDSVVAVSTGSQATQTCKYMTGKETDEQEEDGIKVITAAWCEGKTFYSDEVRVGEFKGMSRSEAFDMVMKDCKMLNDGADKINSANSDGKSSSSGKGGDSKSSSSGKSEPQYENPFTDLKVGECNFKMEDKVWEYVSYSDNFGLGDEYKLHYYQYKDGGSIDSTYTYTFGSSARTLCRLGGDQDTSYTNNYGAKVHFKSWCTSNGMEEFEILKNTDQDKSREAAFREFMTWCKALNDVSDESSSSTEGDDDSSSSAKAESSSSSVKRGESCKAKVDDEVWYFERDYSDQGISEYYSIVTWDGNKATSKTVIAQKSQSESICKSTLSGLQAMKDNPGEKNEYVCDGATLIKTTTTDPFQYSNSEKKQYYESMMLSWCGIKVDASSSSTNSSSSGKAESSSSEKPSSSSVASSSSEAPKSSSSSKKTEITYPTKYGKSCEFKPEDDAWYVENKEVKYYAVYEWTGNTVKKTAVMFNVTDDAESCSTLKGMWPECSAEGSSCACDNEILVVTTTVQEEVESKTDAYVAAMHDQCGILVEIESSSSAVNHCAFEKTDSEWTFVLEEETDIFNWDSNDQYTYTVVTHETYIGDEVEEGEECEECLTAQQKCLADAAEAVPEDDDYTFTYSCEDGVMTTTSVSKEKQGNAEERNAIFEEMCLYEE
jgi:hypothetical protein